MKVAILFAGRITGYEKVIHRIKDMVKMYNMKAYCSLNEPENSEYIDKFRMDLGIESKNMNIEETVYPSNLDSYNWMRGTKYNNVYSMFYHENKAFSLLERDAKINNIHYDCILYYRADMKAYDKLILQRPRENTVYIPSDKDYHGINDRMAYGDFTTMKKYCSLINSFDDLCSNLTNINPEKVLKLYLDKSQLSIIRFIYSTILETTRSNKCSEYRVGIDNTICKNL